MISLRKILSRFLKDQRGSALVIVASALVALIGFAALVVDIGLIAANRQQLVNLMDATALSGSQELPDETKAIQEAKDYSELNNFDPEKLSYSVSEDKKNLTVSGNKNINLAFAKVFGIFSRTVSATATAQVQALTSYQGVAPLTIKESKLVNLFNGQEIELKSGDPEVGPGNFGPLTVGEDYDYEGSDPGASDYKYNLSHGCPQTIRVNDILPLKPGNMTGPTGSGISELIAGDSCTLQNHTPDCKRIIIIPVYKDVPYVLNGRTCITVQGFTSFFVTRVSGSKIYGKFIETLKEGEVSPTQNYYGVGKPTLIA